LPTMKTKSMFLSCAIDAKEGRTGITCDMPGVFMQATMDETVIMCLAGPLVIPLAKVDPKLHNKYLVTEKGKPVMCARLSKAFCGTPQAASLFWKNLTGLLAEWGFELNPCDACVANKTINGNQCAIVWHVDNLKISHVDAQVVEDTLVQLNKQYRKRAPLTVTRGNMHVCLGITIDYTTPGKVAI